MADERFQFDPARESDKVSQHGMTFGYAVKPDMYARSAYPPMIVNDSGKPFTPQQRELLQKTFATELTFSDDGASVIMYKRPENVITQNMLATSAKNMFKSQSQAISEVGAAQTKSVTGPHTGAGPSVDTATVVAGMGGLDGRSGPLIDALRDGGVLESVIKAGISADAPAVAKENLVNVTKDKPGVQL